MPCSNLGPLVYEASVLPTEVSFWMKNWKKIMTIYIWFVVQQMYVSLTYPFNIVQHTLLHIVEHRKLDSLATPNNIVWLTVTSCWTNNVRQFDPSLTCRFCCICHLFVSSTQQSRYATLSVASCELSVASCELSVDICQLRDDICQLSVASCELLVDIYQLRVDICQLSVVSCELISVSCELQADHCSDGGPQLEQG